MYIVTNVGAIRVALADGPGRAWWAVVLPACGILVAGYTLFKHVSPVPEAPYDLFPYIVAAWLAAGLAVTFLVPGFTERIAGRLRLAPGSEQPELAPALDRL